MTGLRMSVAMCTFNGVRFIAEQLDSLLKQTRLPDELLVCDDCSSDSTVEIVEGFRSIAPFPVRMVVNDVNLGITKNFEQAICIASGDAILLSNFDDIWLPTKLERTEQAFLADPESGLVLSDAEVVDERLRPMCPSLWRLRGFTKTDQRLVRRGANDRILRRNLTATYGTTMALRSRFRDVIVPIPDCWREDAWIALMIAGVASISLVPEPLVRYRQHGGNASGSASETFSHQLARSSKDGPAVFLKRAEDLRLARERLAGCGASPGFVRRVADAELHMRKRAWARPRKWSALGVVGGDFLSGRYRRYSGGWRSALADIVMHGA